jgi:aryl-alcohol dehydrogenase-like predicted oxidoreductase
VIESKLCLGTVQFGLNYGINNSLGVPASVEIENIFSLAEASNIKCLDTAFAYGDSEEKLGNLSRGKFEIITKFSKVKDEKTLADEFASSLSRLRVDSVYGYMAHSADTLIEHPELWNLLREFKIKGKVNKIGYSLYSFEQLEKLLELNFIPDIVQVPYSLFDRKFERFFPKLKTYHTEIHVRSVFLQGLYFMDTLKLPSKLIELKSSLERLHACCRDANINVGALALNFAVNNPNIGKVVIGVDNVKQLKENIEHVNSWQENLELTNCINEITVEKKELLNPANW